MGSSLNTRRRIHCDAGGRHATVHAGKDLVLFAPIFRERRTSRSTDRAIGPPRGRLSLVALNYFLGLTSHPLKCLDSGRNCANDDFSADESLDGTYFYQTKPVGLIGWGEFANFKRFLNFVAARDG
jgi:hypothetical protein